MDAPRRGRNLFERYVETALIPINAAISKPAQKAYLGTSLFIATSFVLFGVATLAYALFYYNYVPQNSVERVIHLQFGDSNPYGTATLSSALTSLQAYDVTLCLHLPRTPNNIAAGNFMLDLSLLAPNRKFNSDVGTPFFGNNTASVLARSRRTAILTYASPIVDMANTLSGLPLHLLGWKKESEILEVSMFEGLEFAKGWANVPQSVNIIVEADQIMQFYDVSIRIIARFGGLRWILYHHRVLSFLFFATTFWSSSMLSMLLAWFAFSSYFAKHTSTKTESILDVNARMKSERENSEVFDPTSLDDISDTPRAFPTLGRQKPLQFTSRPAAVKKENNDGQDEEEIVQSMKLRSSIAGADDEDDDMTEVTSGWRDSGLGTGLDEGRVTSVQRRRKALVGDGGRGA